MEPPRPEYRYEPLRSEWVIVSPGRASRPRGATRTHTSLRTSLQTSPAAVCPFCPGHEGQTPPEVYAARPSDSAPNTPGWRVRVVPNKYPALAQELPPRSEPVSGTDRAPWPAHGFHEVVIETPEHDVPLAARSAESVFETLVAWRERMRKLASRGVACVHIFRNDGHGAGATIHHPHSQIIAPSVLGPVIAREARAFARHWRRRGSCLLCERIARECSLRRRSIARSERFVAFCPFAARVPFEICVAPIACTRHFFDTTDDDLHDLGSFLPRLSAGLAATADSPPFNLLLHSAPLHSGPTGPADHPFHWHLAILPRTGQLAGFEWASGIHINQVPPEVAARRLRDEFGKDQLDAPITFR